MKSQSTVNRHLRELRQFINNSQLVGDDISARIAYTIECAVRWAREDTVDWPGLVAEAECQIECLRNEIEAKAKRTA